MAQQPKYRRSIEFEMDVDEAVRAYAHEHELSIAAAIVALVRRGLEAARKEGGHA